MAEKVGGMNTFSAYIYSIVVAVIVYILKRAQILIADLW